MVTSWAGKAQPISHGTARRLRRNAESVPNNIVMTTVVCDECGERFAVVHRPAFQDASVAERQATWLKDRFVWDHIQEQKHSWSIPLPGGHEMKPAPKVHGV